MPVLAALAFSRHVWRRVLRPHGPQTARHGPATIVSKRAAIVLMLIVFGPGTTVSAVAAPGTVEVSSSARDRGYGDAEARGGIPGPSIAPATNEPQPPGPTSLTIDPLPRRRALLRWNWQPAAGFDNVSYEVQSRFSTDDNDWALRSLEVGDTSDEITLDDIVDGQGLQDHARFQLRVRAIALAVTSAWSEAVTIVDNPLLHRDGFAFFKADGLHTKAYLGWDPIAGVIDSSYTVRYRELPASTGRRSGSCRTAPATGRPIKCA